MADAARTSSCRFNTSGPSLVDGNGKMFKARDADDLAVLVFSTLAVVAAAVSDALGEAPRPILVPEDGHVRCGPELVVPREAVGGLGLRYAAAAGTGATATDTLAPYLGWLALADLARPADCRTEGTGVVRFMLRHAWAAHLDSRDDRMAREDFEESWPGLKLVPGGGLHRCRPAPLEVRVDGVDPPLRTAERDVIVIPARPQVASSKLRPSGGSSGRREAVAA